MTIDARTEETARSCLKIRQQIKPEMEGQKEGWFGIVSSAPLFPIEDLEKFVESKRDRLSVKVEIRRLERLEQEKLDEERRVTEMVFILAEGKQIPSEAESEEVQRARDRRRLYSDLIDGIVALDQKARNDPESQETQMRGFCSFFHSFILCF